MKKLFTAILICISFLVGKLEAQDDRTFEGNILIGFNLSQIDGDLLAGFNKIGLNAGARVGVSFSERWKASVGLQFAQGGSSFGNNEFSSSQFDRIQLNKVEVPLLVHFKEWKFNLNAGLIYSRLINYKITDVVGEDLTDVILFQDDLLSITIGATYFINDKWGVDFLWSKSLTDLMADPDASTFLTRDLTFRLLFML